MEKGQFNIISIPTSNLERGQLTGKGRLQALQLAQVIGRMFDGFKPGLVIPVDTIETEYNKITGIKPDALSRPLNIFNSFISTALFQFGLRLLGRSQQLDAHTDFIPTPNGEEIFVMRVDKRE